MSELRAAVYVAPPIPFHAAPPSKGSQWSPISCTLIYSAEEAVLVDTPITIKQTEYLLEWIDNIAPKRKLAISTSPTDTAITFSESPSSLIASWRQYQLQRPE